MDGGDQKEATKAWKVKEGRRYEAPFLIIQAIKNHLEETDEKQNILFLKKDLS